MAPIGMEGTPFAETRVWVWYWQLDLEHVTRIRSKDRDQLATDIDAPGHACRFAGCCIGGPPVFRQRANTFGSFKDWSMEGFQSRVTKLFAVLEYIGHTLSPVAQFLDHGKSGVLGRQYCCSCSCNLACICIQEFARIRRHWRDLLT